MKDLFKFPLNIQMFAADGGAGASEGNSNSQTTETPNEQTFTQADIDRAVTRAVQTATENAATRQQDAINQAVADAIAEEQRKAQLTEEQRQEEARTAAAKALEEKERELNIKLLRVDTSQLLNDEGLPLDSIDLVLGNDIESTKANIEILKGIITKAVETQVETLVTTPGAPKGQSGKTLTKEEIMNIQDRTARQKAIEENIHLFNQ